MTEQDRRELQIRFEKETGTKVTNSQEEFDIDYVAWLEERVFSLNAELADRLLPSDVAELLRWHKQLTPAQKCTVHPPAGSGGSHGIYNHTEEELIEKWSNIKLNTFKLKQR